MSLSPDTEALFSSARDTADQPTAAVRERNLAAVLTKIGASASAAAIGVAASSKAGAAPAGTAVAAAGTAKAGALLAAKVLVPLALMTAIGASVAVSMKNDAASAPAVSPSVRLSSPPANTAPSLATRSEPRMTPISDVPVVAVEDIPAVASAMPKASGQGRPLPVRDVTPAPAETATTATDASAHLREEVGFVAKIDEAERAGDHARVFALVREHERLFPDGILYEECNASAAIAFCKASTAADARSRAENFRARYPKSPLLPRVAAACEK